VVRGRNVDNLAGVDHVGVPDLRVGGYKFVQRKAEHGRDAAHRITGLNYVLVHYPDHLGGSLWIDMGITPS
jgi:hypothetical protein